jgi:hypothetical protein
MISPAQGALRALADRLGAAAGRISALSAAIGLDGFIDEMISVVGERRSPVDYTPLPSMADLAAAISAAAGHNSLREIVVRSQDAGGCALNLGDGLLRLGVAIDFIGTLGSPRHPSFDGFAGACRSVRTLGRAYGRTLAFEFGDGKFMFSAVSQLGEVDPELLAAALADGGFAAACRSAALIALTNWTLFPHMTACWRLLQREVLSRLGRRLPLLIDLVDPSVRSEADIRLMLETVTLFERDCDTVLGLNLNEARVIGHVLGLGELAAGEQAMVERARRVRTALGIAQVVIHSARCNALSAAGGEVVLAAGPHCRAPRKTTGAGDRFNAGYGLGLMLGLDAPERLMLAAAVSGVFVRAARSATLDEVIAFLAAWGDGREP